MRCIDADALKRQYEDRKRLFCRNRIEFSTLSDKDKARVDELDNCIADILNAPNIEPDWTELMAICDNCGHAIHIKRTDAKPKTGKWIDRQLIYSDLHVATCSNCKMRVAVGKYCPNCGAKMEEGE